MSRYARKTDWICKECESINDLNARKCYSCGRKRNGTEKRLPNK